MKKIVLRISGLIATIMMLLQITAYADFDKMNISQMIQKERDVYVYVNALDENKKPIKETLSGENFTVNNDLGQNLKVEDGKVSKGKKSGVTYTFCIDISKSVTEEEMNSIKNSISDFVDHLSDKDYARLVTIGGEVVQICEATQDTDLLHGAIDTITRSANKTYLYEGISFALNEQKNSTGIPKRAAIILFTDGMDDSDGKANEENVLLDNAETRIPIYVIGLKGNDSQANLESVSNISRQSGGSVFSYSEMDIPEGVNLTKEYMDECYKLHVRPEEDAFGKKDLVWKVLYKGDGDDVTSTKYVYTLNKDGVSFETESETETETETQKTTSGEGETEKSKSITGIFGKVGGFLKDNLVIVLIALVVIFIICMIILFIVLGKKKKSEKFDIETNPSYEYDFNQEFNKEMEKQALNKQQAENPMQNPYQRGRNPYQGQNSYQGVQNPYQSRNPYQGSNDRNVRFAVDNEETVGMFNNKTMDSFDIRSEFIEFDIIFEGMKRKVRRDLRQDIILGRGNAGVDIVLGSRSEAAMRISRTHAMIVNQPDGIYIKDNFKNKTYLNGREVIGETLLHNNDVIQMGNAVVKVYFNR